MLTSEQDRVLHRVLRLVDLSGDLDRNKSDSDFADAGGIIHRVIDENIFEMFIRPWRHREAVETFYADLWSPTHKVDKEWRSFEAQAALITAEFIISGGDRNSDGEILMSDHHRWELAHRVEALTSEIRAEITSSRKAVRKAMKTKLAVSADLERGRVDRSAGFIDELKSRSLAADIAELADAPEPVVNRFKMARVSAAFFANDPLTEPLDQLRRTVSPELRGRLTSVQTLYKTTRTEAAAIETDAERWFERLAQELRQPGHRRRVRAQRDLTNAMPGQQTKEDVAKALRNDARTIAFVQWIARSRSDPSQRIVFITGDAVLFDAYRRWHVTNSAAGRAAQPFVLRRATQYSPIFNPADGGGDLSIGPAGHLERSVLFTLIQQAVEAALLPLPFALQMQTRVLSDPLINLTRERLALKLVDTDAPSADEELSALSDILNATWVQARGQEIEGIRESWQKAQRFAIGASTDLITPRLGKALKDAAAQYFNEAARNAGPILSGYVAKVLDKLVDDSILLWMPLAEEFDQGKFDEDPKASTLKRRFRVALKIPSVDTDTGPMSGTSPQAVFARTACRALEIQDIANANRFANLARRADRVAGVRRGQSDQVDPDLLYLQSITYRYLITTVDSHLKRSRTPSRRNSLVAKGVDQVKQYYGQAANLIDKCLAIHAGEIDEPENLIAQWAAQVRYLRALSERASLNLFMATSLGLAMRAGPSILLEDYQRHLEYARADLWRCVKVDTYDDEDDPILQVTRAQYIPNIAGYEVLAYILSEEKNSGLQPWPRVTKRRIKTVWGQSSDIHPLLEAELIGYFILSGDPVANSRVVKRDISRNQRQLRLPLDRELYRALYRELPRPGAQKRSGRRRVSPNSLH